MVTRRQHELFVGLNLVSPDQQGLVVLKQVVLDCLLDQLCYPAQGQFLKLMRSTDLYELSTAIPTAWNRSIELFGFTQAFINLFSSFPVRLCQSVGKGATPLHVRGVEMLVLSLTEMKIQEVLHLLVVLKIDLTKVLGRVDSDPSGMGHRENGKSLNTD